MAIIITNDNYLYREVRWQVTTKAPNFHLNDGQGVDFIACLSKTCIDTLRYCQRPFPF